MECDPVEPRWGSGVRRYPRMRRRRRPLGFVVERRCRSQIVRLLSFSMDSRCPRLRIEASQTQRLKRRSLRTPDSRLSYVVEPNTALTLLWLRRRLCL